MIGRLFGRLLRQRDVRILFGCSVMIESLRTSARAEKGLGMLVVIVTPF